MHEIIKELLAKQRRKPNNEKIREELRKAIELSNVGSFKLLQIEAVTLIVELNQCDICVEQLQRIITICNE